MPLRESGIMDTGMRPSTVKAALGSPMLYGVKPMTSLVPQAAHSGTVSFVLLLVP